MPTKFAKPSTENRYLAMYLGFTVLGLVLAVLGTFAALTRTAHGQTLLMSTSSSTPPGPALWPPGPYRDMAPSGRESALAVFGPGLDQGALRQSPITGQWEIVFAKLPTPTDPLEYEWIPYDPNNPHHWRWASLFNRYGPGISKGPAHSGHRECYGYYLQVYGEPPSDMRWRDCEHSNHTFRELKKLLPAGLIVPDAPTDPISNNPLCGNRRCDLTRGETNANCPIDCRVGSPVLIPPPPDPDIIIVGDEPAEGEPPPTSTCPPCADTSACTTALATCSSSLATCTDRLTTTTADLLPLRADIARLRATQAQTARQLACFTAPDSTLTLPPRCLQTLALGRSLADSRTRLQLGPGWAQRFKQCEDALQAQAQCLTEASQ